MRCKRGSPGLRTTIHELLWLTQDLAVEHLETILTFFLHGGDAQGAHALAAQLDIRALQQLELTSPRAQGPSILVSPQSRNLIVSLLIFKALKAFEGDP